MVPENIHCFTVLIVNPPRRWMGSVVLFLLKCTWTYQWINKQIWITILDLTFLLQFILAHCVYCVKKKINREIDFVSYFVKILISYAPVFRSRGIYWRQGEQMYQQHPQHWNHNRGDSGLGLGCVVMLAACVYIILLLRRKWSQHLTLSGNNHKEPARENNTYEVGFSDNQPIVNSHF